MFYEYAFTLVLYTSNLIPTCLFKKVGRKRWSPNVQAVWTRWVSLGGGSFIDKITISYTHILAPFSLK